MELNDLLREMISSGATDMHLVSGWEPRLRIDGALQGYVAQAPMLRRDEVLGLAAQFFGFDVGGDCEVFPLIYTNSTTRHDRRFRGTLLLNDMSSSLVVRLLPKDVPPLDRLELPQEFMRVTELSHGLVIITGATGSGKTTTLYSVAEEFDHRPLCICILEEGDGLELTPGEAVVHQISYDPMAGAAEAFHHAMLADADVIFGFIEDEHDLMAAVKCAETGHLVIANYGAATVEEALRRLTDLAATFAHGESRLANALVACVSQKLASKEGGGRRAVLEVLWCDEDAKAVIRGDEPLENVAELLQRKGNLARGE